MLHWLNQSYKRLGLVLKKGSLKKHSQKDRSSDAAWKFEEKLII